MLSMKSSLPPSTPSLDVSGIKSVLQQNMQEAQRVAGLNLWHRHSADASLQTNDSRYSLNCQVPLTA